VFGEMRHTVTGRLSYEVKGGDLQGVSVWDAIVRDYAHAQGRADPAPTAAHTEFSDVRGSSTISRGIMSDRGVSATLPALALSGAGKLDLTDLTLDYNLKGRVTGTPPGGAGSAGLKGASLGLHVTGALGNLRVQPDLGSAGRPKVAAGQGGE
jgi:AsmA protein